MKYFTLMIAVILFGTSAMAQLSPTNPMNFKPAEEFSQQNISRANLIIPVSNFYRNDNSLNMTITKNAGSYETKSRNASIIAYQKTSSISPGMCPLINASSMNKSVNNYKAFRGSADIVITFATDKIAKLAEQSECILVRQTQ